MCASTCVIAQNPLTGNGAGNINNGPVPRFNNTNNLVPSNIYQGAAPNSNVGIGIALPAAPLHLVFNNTQNTGVRVDQQSNAASALILNHTNTGAGGKNWQLWSTGPGNPEGVGNFLIRDNTAAQNRFFISGLTGKVGIGTISPTRLLDVNGDANITSNIYSAGNLEVINSVPGPSGGRIYAGNAKSIHAAASINAYNTVGGYALFVETNNANPNLCNAVFAVNHTTTRALTVIDPTIPGPAPIGALEYFTVFGDGSTHMGKNVQIGFPSPLIQDANTSLNIETLGQNGINLKTWNNAAKIITLNNTNFSSDPFTLYGEGYAHLANCMQLGFSSNVIQRNDILMNINAINKMGISSLTNHSGDGGYNTLITVNRALTKALVVVGPGLGPTGSGENFVVNGNGRTMIAAQTDAQEAFVVLDKSTFWNNFTIMGDGKTYIGKEKVIASRPNSMLTVAGEVDCKSLYVLKPATWSDYVFDKKYKLTDLTTVENYIKENNHLPGVPSEKDVLENGYDVNKADAVLLAKIEELYLYIIKQDKEIQELKSKIK
ncbi:MAG: hypothetical protein Q8L81_04295 [Bacteroidota bacterium]|nr:hypothetical protein [Bacteroidota bacterium]